jgi:hypothetical protein
LPRAEHGDGGDIRRIRTPRTGSRGASCREFAARGKGPIVAGIVASRDGAIVTNHHVVEGCSAIVVVDSDKKRATAERIASDPKNDLALIRAKRSFSEVATFRKGVALQPGESVTVVGYPLASILGSEPNVAFGYRSGRVIGIVSAKLDALAVQKRTGDLPQNISFGIKAELAQSLLEAHNVSYQSGAEKRKLENTEVAALGRAITVLVACRRGN